MDNIEKIKSYIFARLYQSYLTGGDTYNFLYKTEDNEKIKNYKLAIKNLEDTGYISVVFQSDRKTRMALTNKGIEYATSIGII